MKSHGSNNKRKDGFLSTSKVHITKDGTIEKLKIGIINNKPAYFKVKNNIIVPNNKTCFKNQVVNGRISKEDYEEDYCSDSFNECDNFENISSSHYQDSNGTWHHTADGW